MILLDTNVISEQMRTEPSLQILTWFKNYSSEQLFLSTITEAELLRGIAILPDGKLKSAKTALLGALVALFCLTKPVPDVGLIRTALDLDGYHALDRL